MRQIFDIKCNEINHRNEKSLIMPIVFNEIGIKLKS